MTLLTRKHYELSVEGNSILLTLDFALCRVPVNTSVVYAGTFLSSRPRHISSSYFSAWTLWLLAVSSNDDGLLRHRGLGELDLVRVDQSPHLGREPFRRVRCKWRVIEEDMKKLPVMILVTRSHHTQLAQSVCHGQRPFLTAVLLKG